jgi:hypothetical protein
MISYYSVPYMGEFKSQNSIESLNYLNENNLNSKSCDDLSNNKESKDFP